MQFTELPTAAIDDKKESIARGLDSAASSLHTKADSLPGGPKVASAAHTTAEAMEKAADYVREQDLGDMLSDAQGLVKRYPGVVLLAAATLGFVIARSMSRN